MRQLLAVWLVGCETVVPGASTVPPSEDDTPVGQAAAPARVTERACTAGALPSLDVPLDERVYSPEAVDPALASAPYCVGEPQVCGVGDPFPFKDHHVKVRADGATRDELVLFLTGSGGECDSYEVLPRVAAAAGHPAVCLGYPNEEIVALACAGSDDAECGLDYRSELLYGEDRSSRIEVTRPNSVAGRLAALLVALAAEDPAGGWDRFLTGDDVRWDRVAAIGFSQGAGHVGLLGRDHRLARAVLLSGGGDVDGDALADWSFDPRATPAEATFLYWHTAEPIHRLMADLALLWVGSEPVDADAEAFPYRCSRVATTSRPTVQPHGIVAWDPYLELGQDGWPVDVELHLWHLLASAGVR